MTYLSNILFAEQCTAIGTNNTDVMFCHVLTFINHMICKPITKQREQHRYLSTVSVRAVTVSSLLSWFRDTFTMFITVAISEGTECLFNPDCMVNVLLAAVKKRSDIPKKGTEICNW